MKHNYETILDATLDHEGGWANHPADPGGATYRGVIQRTYDTYRRAKGLRTRSVRKITESELQDIYRTGYWNKVRGDELPGGPDCTTFDSAVNSGPSRGIKWLQKAVGAVQDGRIGPQTLGRALTAHPVQVVKDMCRYRMGFLQALRHWNVFRKGWTRRVAVVEALGVKLALAQVGRTAEGIKDEANREADQAQKSAKRNAGGAAGSGAAGGGTATQVDPSQFDTGAGLIVFGVIIVAVAVTAYLVWRSKVQKSRERAYRDIAAKG